MQDADADFEIRDAPDPERLDNRFKVDAMRSATRAALFFTHAIAFFETRDEASARRREIIANWQAANYAQKPRIGRRRRRTAWLASRDTGVS